MIEQNFSADYLRNYRIRQEGTPAELKLMLTSQSPETHTVQYLSGPISLSDKGVTSRTHYLTLMRCSLTLEDCVGFCGVLTTFSFFFSPHSQCLSPRGQCWVDLTLHLQTPTVRCPPCPASAWQTIYLCK